MKEKSRGFTLIELMVVVVVISIMTGFSVARLVDFRDKRQIFNDAKLVVEELRRVRTKATAVEVPGGCLRVQYYEMALSGSNLVTRVICESGSVDGYLNSSLDNGTFASDYVVTFDSYGRSSADEEIDVCQSGQGYRVTVSIDGVIGQPEEIVGGCS